MWKGNVIRSHWITSVGQGYMEWLWEKGYTHYFHNQNFNNYMGDFDVVDQ